MNKKVTVLDKDFEIFIESKKIQDAIENLANKMNEDLKGKDACFLPVNFK